MLSIPIIAANITNLTDARYFAAQGVDYLLFDLDVLSCDQVLEIKEWVSGPEILLVTGAKGIHQLEETLVKVSPMMFAIRHDTDYDPSHLLPFVDCFQIRDHKGEIEIAIGDKIFVEVQNIQDDPLDPELSGCDGFIVNGDVEIKLGMKQYEQLDHLFSLIRNEPLER